MSAGGSHFMHALKTGDMVRATAPVNNFRLQEGTSPALLLAGGIGVTPLLCMAQRLATSGADFVLHYCTRSAQRTAFRDEIAASGYAGHVQFHFDDGAAAQRLDIEATLGQPNAGTHLYVCGPTGFIDWVVKAAERLGWSKDHVHLEYFGAAPQDTAGDRAFQVKIASSGASYEVPADQTVVQALQAHGIEILTSCEQGVCGTCITLVL